jgi:hypothetical protein
MRLFSPKRPTIEETIEMSTERDHLFVGDNMDIEAESLVQNFLDLGINDIPKLGHSHDL